MREENLRDRDAQLERGRRRRWPPTHSPLARGCGISPLSRRAMKKQPSHTKLDYRRRAWRSGVRYGDRKVSPTLGSPRTRVAYLPYPPTRTTLAAIVERVPWLPYPAVKACQADSPARCRGEVYWRPNEHSRLDESISASRW